MTEAHIDDVLRLLGSTFGPGFDRGWYEWKHRSNSWGASPGWVAVDEDGLVGVRMLLRWEFQSQSAKLNALRPCDTATAARARGRGVFRALTEAAFGEMEAQCDLFYNTPNEQSLPGYLKMDFEEWTRVPQRLGVVAPRKAELVDSPQPSAETGESLRTPLSRSFIDWRYGACPVFRYDSVGLASSESSCGTVYRVRSWRGLKVLVVAELWGDEVDRRGLLGAIAARERIPLIWTVADHRPSLTGSLARTPTVVTHRKCLAGELQRPVFSMGDIERVL